MPLAHKVSEVRFDQPRSDYSIELLPSGVVRLTDRQPWPFTQVVEITEASRLTFADQTIQLEVQRAPEFLANAWSPGPQIRPTVTTLSDGSLVVSWLVLDHPGSVLRSPGTWSLWARKFDASGQALSQELELTPCRPVDEAGAQGVEPDRLAATGDGGFVAVWRSQQADGQGWGIEVQHFGSDLQPLNQARRVNLNTAGDQEEPSVAVLPSGRIVVAWASSEEDGSGRGIVMRILDAKGAPLGSTRIVNSTTQGDQAAPEIVSLAGGGFAVIWNDLGAGSASVRYRLFDAEGAAAGGEQSLAGPTNALLSAGTAAALPNGGFVLVYEAHCPWGCFDDIRAQRFDSTGAPIGESLRVNEAALSRVSNVMPQVASRPDGSFIVTWSSWDPAQGGWDVRARSFDAQGTPAGASAVLSVSSEGQQSRPDVAVLPDGRPAYVWQTLSSPDSTWDIAGTSALEPVGTLAIFTLKGDAGANVLDLPGARILDGGPGADRMVGDSGDTVYRYDATGDLAVETAGGGIDTILSQVSLRLPPHVEHAFLLGVAASSAVGNELSNRLTGNAANNLLDGGSGSDTLDAGAGADTLIGGAGADVLIGGDGDDLLVDDDGLLRISAGTGHDTIDLLGSLAPNGLVDGGVGNDLLRVRADADLARLTTSGVERVDGAGATAGQRFLDWLKSQNIGLAQNLTVALDPSRPIRELDISWVTGSVNLRGTNAADLLIGNSQDNRVDLLGDASGGPFGGADTVLAGAGDDVIVWSIHPGRPALESFSQTNPESRTYGLSMLVDGGAGNDRLLLNLGNTVLDGRTILEPWLHAGDNASPDAPNAPKWTLDLTGIDLRGVEVMQITGYNAAQPGRFPAEILFSFEQIRDLKDLVLDEDAPSIVRVAGLGEIENRIVGSAANDQLTGAKGPDVILGGSGNDTLVGAEGNDLLLPGVGNDVILGGSGSDTVAFDGPYSAYSIKIDALTRVVTVRATDPSWASSGTDTLIDVELLRFSDRSLPAPAPLDLTDAYRMFVVAFGAAPGLTYLRQVIDAYEGGASTRQIVNAFVAKPEFTSAYPRFFTNEQFAAKLVDSVVGSTAATAAKAQAARDIVSALEAGVPQGDVVFSIFGNLAARSFDDPTWGNTARMLANKVAVARYYTEDFQGATTDLPSLRYIIARTTPDTDVSSTSALRAMALNRPPVFDSTGTIDMTGDEDKTFTFSVTLRDRDEGDVPSLITSGGFNGTPSLLAVDRTGDAFIAAISYTPLRDFNGTDTFIIIATDRYGATTTQSVFVNILALNDPPFFLATAPITETSQDTAVEFTARATDPDLGDSITYSVLEGSTLNGRVTGGEDGRFVFIPDPGFVGSASCIIQVVDGVGASATQMFNFTVIPASTGQGSQAPLSASLMRPLSFPPGSHAGEGVHARPQDEAAWPSSPGAMAMRELVGTAGSMDPMGLVGLVGVLEQAAAGGGSTPWSP